MKTATKNCFLRSEPLASAEATIMKNHLPIDNPPKAEPQDAAKRPALPIHAGKGFRRLMSMIMVLPAK